MKDAIYYGNILGLLKMGRWNLSVNETEAMLAIVKESEARYKAAQGEAPASALKPVTAPVKKEKKVGPK